MPPVAYMLVDEILPDRPRQRSDNLMSPVWIAQVGHARIEIDGPHGPATASYCRVTGKWLLVVVDSPPRAAFQEEAGQLDILLALVAPSPSPSTNFAQADEGLLELLVAVVPRPLGGADIGRALSNRQPPAVRVVHAVAILLAGHQVVGQGRLR